MKALSVLLLCALLGACKHHIVTARAEDPSGTNPTQITFDVPPSYIAASGHRIVTLAVDAKTVYTLDIDGKVAWRVKGLRLERCPWNEAARALGLPPEPTP